MKLPVLYEQQMKTLLKDEFQEYLDSLQLPANKGLRVNQNKISTEDFRLLWSKLELPELEKIPWIHNGFFIPENFDAAGLSLYQAGLFYIQEPAAMTPAEYLPVEEGDYVLDLCAAPGGKSTELLSKLHGTGVLFSNDISASRAKALRKNLEMAGAVNAFVTAETPEKLSGFFPSFFQKILIDAPCSGEGMFRVQPKMMQHWETCGPDYYAPIQRELLEYAWRMLAPGGMMMYSTCTFSETEDEEQILKFLKRHPDMKAVPIPLCDGFETLHEGNGFVRLYPHKIRGEGQFAALLKKDGKTEGHSFVPPLFLEKNQERYRIPQGMIPERSLHYLMTGLHVGTVKNGILTPSQADAMAESPKTWPDVLNLTFQDIRVEKYLKGETLELFEQEMIPVPKKKDKQNKKDLTLICVEGYPLGFGKRNRNLMKNMRNPGWRTG